MLPLEATLATNAELSSSGRPGSEAERFPVFTSCYAGDGVRAPFQNRPVTWDLKNLALERPAGRSPIHEQPWRFILARKSDGADFERILNLLVPFNQAWAKSAPVLMITLAKRTFCTRRPQPPRPA